MDTNPTTCPDRSFFNTRRVTTWCIVLVLGGLAVPSLRSGTGAVWLGKLTGAVSSARRGDSLGSVRDTARAVATRSRMRGIVEELALYSGKFGMPDSDKLTEIVGRSTATDAWGRRIVYARPTRTTNGWLRSDGPDPKTNTDDVYLPVTYKDLMGSKNDQ